MADLQLGLLLSQTTTLVMSRVRAGNSSAENPLTSGAYAEPHDIASRYLRRQRQLRTLQSTALDSRQPCVLDVYYFGGRSLDEIASLLSVAVRTMKRDWGFARAWRLSRLAPKS
jgi:DNA-directed RNA polymerase specialized sigma24 family protein